MLPARQTISYLTKRFREVGIRPENKHGQNFLIDLNLLTILATHGQVDEHDVVLEVGTGTGSLTSLIAQHAAEVITVEIDARMHQLASEELFELDNVTMLLLDALRNKNNLDDRILQTVYEKMNEHPNRCFKVVANLPYNIATPVISNLLLVENRPVSMTVTIQKELAERIAAKPSTKDYSALSIWVQSQCEVEIVRFMPPSVFWPRPKVQSAIIHLVVDEQRRALIPDIPFFHQFCRSMFFHRRKFLRSVILSAFKKRITKPQVDEILASQTLGQTSRAEELSVPAMLQLCEAVRTTLPK